MIFLAAETEAVEGASNPAIPAVSEMFWGLIFFTLLYVMVKFILLPPVKSAMNDRKATLDADRDATDLAAQQLASADGDFEEQLAGTRAEADRIVDQARTEAAEERQRLLSRAEREVAAMQDLAAGEVADARRTAMAGVKPQVAQLAAGAATQVLRRDVSVKAAESIINRHLDNPN